MLKVFPRPVQPVGTPLFVIGGDVHIHNWQQFNPMEANGLPRRLNIGIHVMRRGFQYATNFNVPLIVNGDLLHSKNSLDPAVVHAVHQLFAREFPETRAILNVGNHEIPDKFNANVTTLDWLADTVDVVKTPQIVELPGVNLHILPFSGDHKAQVARMMALSSSRAVPAIMAAHFPTNGVDLGGYKLESPIEFSDFHPEKFHAVLFNDIHKHQPVGSNGYHLGCTHQNNFGEAGYEFGWWLVTANDHDIHLHRLAVDAPVFSLMDSADEVKQWLDAGHFARVKPEAAIQSALAAQEAPRLAVNTAALPKTIREYINYMVKDGKFKAADAMEIERRALALLHMAPVGGGER